MTTRVYQIKGSELALYFYLLLEFQSTSPRFMALRVGQYLFSVQKDFQRSHKNATLLPQVFPIVLYNGKERWTAPTTLHELVETVLEVGNYGVDVRINQWRWPAGQRDKVG